MKIIGLCGKTGAGKDEAAAAVARMPNGHAVRHSWFLRGPLERNGREPVPSNMSALFEANARVLGRQWLATEALQAVWSYCQFIGTDGDWRAAIVGIRNPDEVAYYREKFGARGISFRLVAIHASEELRFQRVRNRGNRPNEHEMSWEAFRAIEALPAHAGEEPVIAEADVRIDNEGSLEALQEAIKNLF